ncbi:MAG: Anti-sigma-K factor RskA [Friedmanniella sp.]|nr:Anti-sigma-K factor RskA [Friedmanniella sp.]
MSEIHGAVGSYVVNALDPDEVEEFEAHLAVCPTCTREVAEFCETAAQLSLLAPAMPPPALRGSILAAIKEVRPLPPEQPRAQPEPPSVVADPGRVAHPVEQPQAPVDELALRRQRRRTRVLSIAVAAVTVVALGLGSWAFTLVQGRQAQVASVSLETQLLAAPDAKIYPTTMRNGAKVSFVVSASLNRAMFIGDNLPSPGAGKAYQLWTLDRQAKPVADQVVPDGSHEKQFLQGAVTTASGLAVTIEPAGGSIAPTSPAEASVTL